MFEEEYIKVWIDFMEKSWDSEIIGQFSPNGRESEPNFMTLAYGLSCDSLDRVFGEVAMLDGRKYIFRPYSDRKLFCLLKKEMYIRLAY